MNQTSTFQASTFQASTFQASTFQASTVSAAPGTRLYFLDWVRILAFFVLVLYHVGMYYVSWGWHVKSAAASSALEPLMMLSSPWRLGLLFLVSGVAARFMLKKLGATTFMRRRSARLLIPLVFGMLVIVPPQPYFEIIEKIAYQGSYLDFMGQYLRAYHGFCNKDGCLALPTWNHLWFVAYLWCYTIALAALALACGARLDKLSQRLGQLLHGWKLFVLPVAALLALRVALNHRFPSTHALVDDWHNHAHYFLLFLAGALLAGERQFWARLEAARWFGLGLAAFGWCGIEVVIAWPDALVPPADLPYWRLAYSLCHSLMVWSAITAVCGFAHRHLQFDSAKRRYLTQAVFPVYILHQSLIVVLAHALKPAKLAPALEGPMLVVLTLAISFGAFEIIRRNRLLQTLFGATLTEAVAAAPAGARAQPLAA
ncbi:MAG: acyltransferase family protein [Pseudomonadota bacterium]